MNNPRRILIMNQRVRKYFSDLLIEISATRNRQTGTQGNTDALVLPLLHTSILHIFGCGKDHALALDEEHILYMRI